MLSYMLPVEEKSPSPRNINLSLNLNSNNNRHQNGGTTRASGDSVQSQIIDETTKLLDSERDDRDHVNQNAINGTMMMIDTTTMGIDYQTKLAHNQREDSFDSDASSRKIKMGKLSNTKNVTLKRVSFGSSKGSMVETLVFETPTPLPEHAEREFNFPMSDHHHHHQHPKNTNLSHLTNGSCLDDSGIELQEEVERSKVRVTFFQCSQPQQISPPENHIGFFGENNNSILSDSLISSDISQLDKMTATAIQPSYDRQISTESGWDNPFRPGGDLSREADEIVNMIKGGKPITPTGDIHMSIANGGAQKDHGVENGTTVVDGVTKLEVSQTNAAKNGTKSPQKLTNAANATTTATDKPSTNGDATNISQTQTQVIPGPQSASHVVIGDKKKKKSCCVIQ